MLQVWSPAAGGVALVACGLATRTLDGRVMRAVLADTIAVTGSSSEIVYEALPTDDPKQRRPDITLARSLLGWEPKVERREGMRRTLDYFRSKVKG